MEGGGEVGAFVRVSMYVGRLVDGCTEVSVGCVRSHRTRIKKLLRTAHVVCISIKILKPNGL